ncbi:CCDC77 [Acanthosepion pharaonis]|uniref:CCDC77 n=1 Tax=Acanthosepion pharaonis TaxID=158019 RepID=A0A812AV34_ACAPH|nr:CCDC77 [Sepia pharaonis]
MLQGPLSSIGVILQMPPLIFSRPFSRSFLLFTLAVTFLIPNLNSPFSCLPNFLAERSNKMSKRLQMMNTRYQELEKRRHFEVEGFKNDIKNLRSRLKDVERQLYKVTLGLAEEMDEKRPDDLDLRILRNVRLSTGRSQKIMGELKNLKSKLNLFWLRIFFRLEFLKQFFLLFHFSISSGFIPLTLSTCQQYFTHFHSLSLS